VTAIKTVAHDEVQFSYITDAREGRLDLSLHGELDLACSSLLDRVEDENGGDLNEVVVDIAALEFIDTAGVRALADMQSRNQAQGRTVDMINPTRLVRRVVGLFGREDMLAPLGREEMLAPR
jgi:anti-anti-sigma factor